MTGRPTEFDRHEALEKSMELFWSNGYEATSVTELQDAMGIGRQSLYNAFGDKHSLFLEAAQHYVESNGQRLLDTIQGTGSPVENIRDALEQMVIFLNNGECRGCLVTNSIVELAPHDDEVREMVRAMVVRMEKAFKATLDLAVKKGEISTHADTKAMARFFTATVHGLVVMGKATESRIVLADTVKIALSTLN